MSLTILTKEQWDKLTEVQKEQWNNASEVDRITLEKMWVKFHQHSSSPSSKLVNLNNYLGLNETISSESVNKDLEEKIKHLQKVNEDLEKQKEIDRIKFENSTKSLYLKIEEEKKKLNSKLQVSGRKSRPVQVATYVDLITRERLDAMHKVEYALDKSVKKADIFEKSIKDYQKKYHPDLVLVNND